MRPTILIVEDDPGFREAMSLALETAGYATCVAGTMEEAIEKSKGSIPLIAFVDVMLGPEPVRHAELDALKRFAPGLRIVLISGYLWLGSPIQGRYPDVDAFLRKPFRLDALLDIVKELLPN
jgi:DNA-binding NtrC family response regulator